MKKDAFGLTRVACYIGYIVQAQVNNFSPLLFVMFSDRFSVSLTEISLLITINFVLQIGIDLSSAFFVDRIGYRTSVILAEGLSAVGFVALGTLPFLIAPYAGLLISTAILAVGGGLIEVVVSPILEAIPSDNKAAQMSILHSFYCWGQAGVILVSTGFFAVFGKDSWNVLCFLSALIPILGVAAFAAAPMNSLDISDEEEHGGKLLPLFRQKLFWLFVLLMLASGASELAMAQWASLFAEKGLGVSKTLGDLLGPCLFAVLMGIGRVLFGIFGKNGKTEFWIFFSSILCIFSYLLVALSPIPVLSLIGCGLVGLSVAVMWPGTYSLGAKRLSSSGTAMFALLALAGDAGCTVGPDLVGLISDRASGLGIGTDPASAALRIGMLAAAVFPLIVLIVSGILCKKSAKK